MNGILNTIKKRKVLRASAEASLRASGQAPASGITVLDNSEGFSQASAELLATAGAALGDIIIDENLRDHAQAAVQRLESKASKYSNNSLDYCTQKEPWLCDKVKARLISISWHCVEAVYHENPAAQDQVGSELNVEFAIPSSTFGSIKATTFTRYTPDPVLGVGSATYLIIAVRGSASKFDHIVNLNGEPRDARMLFEVGVPGSRSGKAPLGLQAHAGFLNSAKELLPHVFDRISKCLEACPTSNILFTGHSAGGAVVTLLHLAALNRFASTAPDASFSCVTFGAPPSVKLVSEIDQITFSQLIQRSQILNFINEYDAVARLDNDYFRSLISLYNLPNTPNPQSSPIMYENDIPNVHSINLQCPAPVLQHVGELVVLRVEAPNFEPGLGNLRQTSSRLSFWKVSPLALSELLFCRLTVHKREAYRRRIEDLENGFFNGQSGWISSTNGDLL